MNSPANPGRGAPDRPSARRSGARRCPGFCRAGRMRQLLPRCRVRRSSPRPGQTRQGRALGAHAMPTSTIDRRVRELLAKTAERRRCRSGGPAQQPRPAGSIPGSRITEAEVVQVPGACEPWFHVRRFGGATRSNWNGLHLNLARLDLAHGLATGSAALEQVKREVTMDVLCWPRTRLELLQTVAAEETGCYASR